MMSELDRITARAKYDARPSREDDEAPAPYDPNDYERQQDNFPDPPCYRHPPTQRYR